MNILRNVFLCPYVAGTSFKRSSAGGAAALDAFSTIAGGISDLMIQRLNEGLVNKTNQANANIAMMNNESAEKIARENNEFQERLNTVNNQFAHDEALAAFQRQTEWNDPANQVKMVRKAGLNPGLYFGNGAAVGSATSPAAAPHGSGVQSSMPVLSTPHMEAFQYSNPSQSIKNMADAAAALAGAKKQGVETDTLEKSQEDLLRTIHAKGKMADLEAILKERYEDKKRSTELKQMDLNLAKSCVEIYDLAAEGDFKRAQTRLTELKQETEKAVSHMSRENAEIAQKENVHWFELFDAKLNNLQSQTSLNLAGASNQSAQARLSNERASQLEEMHADNVKMNQWLTKKAEQDYNITDMDREAIERTLERKISYLNAHYGNMKGIEKKQYELAVEALKTAKLNNDYYHYKMALETINSCLGLAISAERAQQRGYTRERVVDKDGSFYEEYTPWNE